MNNELRTMNYGKNNEPKKVLSHCSRFIVHNSIPGFTLIELLVVISIIGVLTALVLVNVMGVRERVRDSQRKSDLNQMKKALFLYKNDYDNKYPESEDEDNKIKACSVPAVIEWGEAFKCGEMVYMKILPQDPLYSEDSLDSVYKYLQVGTGDDFCLWATLENKSDSEIANSQKKCSGCSGYVTTETDIVECGD